MGYPYILAIFMVSRWAWLWCHPIGARGHTVVCSGGFGIVLLSGWEFFTGHRASDRVTSLRRFCTSPYCFSSCCILFVYVDRV